MREHWHVSVDNVLIYGISAIIVFNLVKISAAALVQRGGTVGRFGQALGALVA